MMNRERRKEIDRALAMIRDAKAILEEAQMAEQDYYDNMPDSLQGGDKGHAAEAAADALQEAFDACEEVEEACNRATE